MTYEDILELPHHVSLSHPHMPLSDRADAKRLLDEKLQRVLAREGPSGETVFTCFQADERKEGGAYVTLKGHVKKLDPCERAVILTDGTRILLSEIVDIENV